LLSFKEEPVDNIQYGKGKWIFRFFEEQFQTITVIITTVVVVIAVDM